jgi:hypothetical protein
VPDALTQTSPPMQKGGGWGGISPNPSNLYSLYHPYNYVHTLRENSCPRSLPV